MTELEHAKAEFDAAVTLLESAFDQWGGYMPSLATYMRLHADELADRYPDDANGGAQRRHPIPVTDANTEDNWPDDQVFF